MSLNYLNLFLIFGSAFTNNFSLALGDPNQRPLSEYKPISPLSYRLPVHKPSLENKHLFFKQPIVDDNPRPSPAASTNCRYKYKPPPARSEDPVSPDNNSPPPTRKAYVGHPLSEHAGNQINLPLLELITVIHVPLYHATSLPYIDKVVINQIFSWST